MAKIRKILLQTHFYELTLHFDGFFHFSPCSSQNFKKRRALCVDSFLRAIQICPQIYKKTNLKICPPIGVRYFGGQGGPRSHHFLSLLTTFLKSPNRMPKHIFSAMHKDNFIIFLTLVSTACSLGTVTAFQ